MMFHFNLHHITLILNGYLSNISCSPLPFGLLSLQVNGNEITFSHVELPKSKKCKELGPAKLPCYIRPLYNDVPLYFAIK